MKIVLSLKGLFWYTLFPDRKSDIATGLLTTLEDGKMKFECPFCGEKHSLELAVEHKEIRCSCGHPLDLGPLRKWLRHEARRKMSLLGKMADIVCRHILSSDYPAIDIEIEKKRLRDQAMELFPEKIQLYDMIYESRFRRLWNQFRAE